MAGDPINDIKQSKERFNNGVEPCLLNQGFKRLNKREHTMIHHDKKIIMLCMSAPSGTSYPRAKRDLIRELRKKYGKDYIFYLHFNRPRNEWNEKPVYNSLLKQFVSFKSLSGVICGIEELILCIPKIIEKEIFYRV